MYFVLYNVKYNKLESEVKKMNVLRMTNIELIRERDVLSEALESTIENRKNARRLRNQLLTVLNELSNRRLN